MVLSIMNQKGGVGKTTTVINIGYYLASKGFKTLLIDLDPQANLSSGLGIEKKKDQLSTYNLLIDRDHIEEIRIDTKYKNLSIVPSGISLSGAEVEMVSVMSRETVLKQILESERDKYDFILIDCPPSLGLLTINALVASDKVVVPIQAEYFALEGLGQLMNTIKMVKANINPELDIGGVILTMYDIRTNLSKEVASEIAGYFEDKVFNSIIPRNVKLSEAPSFGKPIEEYEPNSTGASSYKNLAQEFINRFQKEKNPN